MNIQEQRNCIRELALKVSEIAKSKENELICRRWRDVNALRKPDRAPVWCGPVGCWKEILPEDSLTCQDPWLRSLEYHFRQVLHKNDIGDDSPLESYFAVNAIFEVDPVNCWGVDIEYKTSSEQGSAWGYDPPLRTEADFDKLRMPSYTYNKAETEELLSRTQGLLGDILEVKLLCGPAYAGMGTLGPAAADLRGLEQIMMDMIAEPRLMHRLMEYLKKARLRQLDAWQAMGIQTANNTGPMLYSDPIEPQPDNGKLTLKNFWCDGNSQLFDQVSPQMWEEFCLNYQKPIFERFGLVCYGCCENLTHKIDGVLTIPNLRIFVCSAWTDLDVVLDRVGSDYCIMWRQKASDVVFPHDIAPVRQQLKLGLERLQGSYYQVILRELQTLAGHPDRLHIWTQTAKELAAKYA